jgi:sigma-B regulation protein RsbU (phosphoserine phosphatase)
MLGRSHQPWQPLEAEGGLPLGILPDAKYVQESVHVAPGDRLFFYTDGVAECPGSGDSLYGDEDMLASLNRHLGKPVAEVRTALREDLTNFAGGTLLHDDVTFLLVEVRQPPPFWKRRIIPGKPRVGALR